MKRSFSTYFPGILLFVIALIVGQLTYQDYGMGWDEPAQRGPGVLNYEYAFHGKQDLFNVPNDNHGAGFEMLLVIVEKTMNITDSRDIFLMRHVVTHIFFLLGMFAGYVLIYRVYKSQLIACIGFLMLILSPRLYGHSFCNSKDIPFLAAFLMTLACSEVAFRKNKTYLFFILGLLCGYTTSIRIMGVMLCSFLLLFMVTDLITNTINKEKPLKTIANTLIFSLGFITTLYLSWPFIWKTPIATVIDSFSKLSHFDWDGYVLFDGQKVHSLHIPWFYIPKWFCITTPVLWLVAGFGGIVFILIDLIKNPLTFFKNNNERNIILWVACFLIPVIAVIALHSVLYDDWRHLYFIYPPFVMCALYVLHRSKEWKYKQILRAVFLIPVATTLIFMIRFHPFQMVYFNSTVSHKKGYLLKNYDLDYWGCAYMQAIQYILSTDNRPHIRVGNTGLLQPVINNIHMLPKSDRERFQWATTIEDKDYIITNFREHPEGFNYPNMVYSITVQNSTILCVYKVH